MHDAQCDIWLVIIFLLLVDAFDTVHPSSTPVIIITNVLAFRDVGKFVASIVFGSDHNILAPVIIDRVAIVIIGLITIMFSDIDEFGLCSRGPHTVTIENRIEQNDVNPTDNRISSNMNLFCSENNAVSIIRSLEQNPAMNGNPHSAVLAINIHVEVIGAELRVLPIHRRS